MTICQISGEIQALNAGKSEAAFIEVQTGEYFGEDDIERIEDDYGRV